MSESDKGTGRQAREEKQVAVSAARRTADKATAPASGAAEKARNKAAEGTSAVAAGARRAADGASGAMGSVTTGVEAGRQAAVAASGRAAALVKTTWTALAHRKLVAAGVGAGMTALGMASYTAGRRSGRRAQGPVTRLTGGRI
ncbi:hypothetical protein QQY24_29235 [Streptomyces sp. TG1A-8]|uniref:hypothetical protein n=1 Tax=Streptomyces sp. TG1A-8 TaxID=3051385 RepID=UPI00265C4D13|nr:hypothetical protein [Streptomyces sp. TG1A-8]MDO0929298.1 hypothetical protein [Streptomyces sp. TG1A-8]